MFPFNQPEKTRDCGYRCLYHIIKPSASYETWLDQFKIFSPTTSGITFSDCLQVLNHYGFDFKFTQLGASGLFLVYSGIFLHPEGKKHGHYFLYHDGTVFCSTRDAPYRMDLATMVGRLEAKSIDHAFRCLQILGKK